MNFREIPIEISKENPFGNCKLRRKQYAEILKHIVLTASDGCVIALNGAWGTGKTTFVRMWKQYLENNDFNTLYFNAWEIDFISDPLVGLIGQLQGLDNSVKDKSIWQELLNNAGEVLKTAAYSFARHQLDKIGLEGGIDKVIEIYEGAKNPFRSEIEQYNKDYKSIQNFKGTLSKWISSLENEYPLVFIVDELDRCSPYYAVKVLERIKHLFSIPNIVFVLSIDKEQLCNSIRGYYGSDKINAEEYLRRFVDIDYYLPEPDYDLFVDFLCSRLGFEELFCKTGRTSDKVELVENFSEIIKHLFQSKSLSLRQMEKILTHMRLSLQMHSTYDTFNPGVFIYLVYLRFFHINYYQGIKHHEYSVQDLVNMLEETIIGDIYRLKDKYCSNLEEITTYYIADLLLMYDYDNTKNFSIEGLLSDMDNNLTFQTSIMKEDTLKKYFMKYKNHSNGRLWSLNVIFNHVDILSIV